MSSDIIGHAFVRSAIAPLFAEGRVSSAQVSQRLAGHPVYVLESRDDHWHRVRGMDAYEGWMHDGYFMRLVDESPVIATTSEDFALTYVPRVSMGVIARSERHGLRALPLGAWLDLDEEIVDGDVVPLNRMEEHFATAPDAIAQSAVEWFEGTSYQWGGITPWGADCSGFVQTIYGVHGVPLPRDAHQQALAGEAVARTALQPADLLFFSDREDGRITHVGVALAGDRLAHIALGRGGFALEWLGDLDDAYVATLNARFVSARRVV
ncbi:MAG: C40 family peptidase [Gemmatimonadaceae bacterium]|nr:C40 family peptidase [Gemmatimonadaceae bacterium]